MNPFDLTISQWLQLVMGYYLSNLPFPVGVDTPRPNFCEPNQKMALDTWRDAVCNAKWITTEQDLLNWLCGEKEQIQTTRDLDEINKSTDWIRREYFDE